MALRFTRSPLVGSLLVVATCATLTVACSHEKEPEAATNWRQVPGPMVQPEPDAQRTAQAPRPAQGAATTSSLAGQRDFVRISDEILRTCNLGSVEDAPKFDTNSADLRPGGQERLGKVSECFRSGPLKGRRLSLVGRADPRGTDAHNAELGERRAKSVATYLEKQGVPRDLIEVRSQGENAASPDDPSKWQEDRRVDLDLVPGGKAR